MEQVNYIFFYYCYIDENNDLIFIKKEKHNLTINNLLTSDNLINIIYNGKKKFTNRSKVFSIVVHNNYKDPLIYLQENELPQYTYETNGLKDIKFQNTHKEFLKLNSVYIFYKNMNIYTYDNEEDNIKPEQLNSTSQSISNNKNTLNKTKKIYISLKKNKKNTRKSIPIYTKKIY